MARVVCVGAAAIYSAHLKLHPLLVLSALVIAEHSLGVWGLLLAGERPPLQPPQQPCGPFCCSCRATGVCNLKCPQKLLRSTILTAVSHSPAIFQTITLLAEGWHRWLQCR